MIQCHIPSHAMDSPIVLKPLGQIHLNEPGVFSQRPPSQGKRPFFNVILHSSISKEKKERCHKGQLKTLTNHALKNRSYLKSK